MSKLKKNKNICLYSHVLNNNNERIHESILIHGKNK